MLSRVDDRDRHLRGGHWLNPPSNIAHPAYLTFTEKLCYRRESTRFREHEGAASAAMTIIATLSRSRTSDLTLLDAAQEC